MTVLEELETAVQATAERSGPAVVGLGRGWGTGSGVVIAPGRVLTNAHNLRHDEVNVTFGDGRRESGKVAGSDSDLDLAVIEVDTGEIEPVDTSAPDSQPALGRAILALGNPGGRGLRVTPGFISSTSRSLRGPRGRRFGGAIEHTAPLPRGSSGGPLLDTDGHLLAINTLREEGGLILAVPFDATTRDKVDALARGESPKKVRLGVAIVPPRAARKLRSVVGLPERDGILVRAVEDASAAERSGIQQGDLIVAAGGKPTDRTSVLYDALEAAGATGKALELTILRGSDERTISVAL
jgi:serine protease Do